MASTPSFRRIAAHLLLSDGRWVTHPVVTLDERGVVCDIESVAHLDSRCGVEFYDGILVAGFVNAHSHLELSSLRGRVASGGGLAAFAQRIGAAKRSAEGVQRAIATADAQMWHEGVSVVADTANTLDGFDVKQNSSIRYVTFAEVYGLGRRDVPDVARSMVAEYGARLVPHSMYSLQDDLLREVVSGGGAEERLSVHLLEDESERELFERRGDMWEWYERSGFECDFVGRYGSPVERLVANVPGGQRVLLVHGCAAQRADVEAVDAHFGANAAWCLCPQSNRYISGLRPPVELLVRSGAHVCVGTDSLASNYSLSVVEELKALDLGLVPFEELVGWATLSGARVLGLDAEYGDVRVGRGGGVVNISRLDMRNLRFTPHSVARRLV